MGEAPEVPAPAAQISWSISAPSVAPRPEPPYASGRPGRVHAAPAGVGEPLHPVQRVLGLPVLLQPVVERERARERRDLLPDQLLLLCEREVHPTSSTRRPA